MLLRFRSLRSWFAAATLIGSLVLLGAGASPAAPGVYTAAQATAGAKLYAARCAACHGARLQGSSSVPALRADAIAPSETVGGFYRFMVETMPAGKPGSLRPSEYASIMAFLLRESGFRSGTAPLTAAAARKLGTRYGAYRRSGL